MTHTLTLKSISQVTPDTHHLVFDRPDGYSFTPGQATDFALDRDGWRDEKRPFTFTSLPDDDTLEFIIKSYPDHDGVTEQIAGLKAGDGVLIEDPWGAIEDKGKGVFIAGGAGVTPFIAILKARLQRDGTLEGCTLIFSNRTEKDIILRDTFEAMQGLDCVWTVTDQDDSPLAHGMIDEAMLGAHVSAGNDVCYVCGPPPMMEAMQSALAALGVQEAAIVTEDLD